MSHDAPTEVSILAPISAWEGINAQTFLAEVKALKGNKVKVSINSPGGDVMQALAMFNGLRATGKSIEVHVLGIAASAASYVAMAGDKIVMPSNTFMLLHNPMTGAFGNAAELQEIVDSLKKIGASLFDTYAKRFKGTQQALRDILATDSLLTAAECLKHGFCDQVVDEIKV